MSLNSELNNLILRKGYVSIDEIHAYCEEHGHKQATGERELRASRSPNVEAVLRDNKTIKGYRVKQTKTYIISDVVERLNAETERMREQHRINNLQQNLL
jgi:hypothetical protein